MEQRQNCTETRQGEGAEDGAEAMGVKTIAEPTRQRGEGAELKEHWRWGGCEGADGKDVATHSKREREKTDRINR
jgi:hypothetical protein